MARKATRKMEMLPERYEKKITPSEIEPEEKLKKVYAKVRSEIEQIVNSPDIIAKYAREKTKKEA